MPSMAFKPSTITSRRLANSARTGTTGSQGPGRAAIAALWLNALVQETELITSREMGSTNAGGKTPNPSRQPVIAKVLLQPSSRTVRSAMPSTSSTDVWPVSYRIAQYTSSDSTRRSFLRAISAIASQSALVSAEPHGLWGELSTSSLVLGVTRDASSCGSGQNWFSSRSGSGTGVAPANLAMDSYIGNPGSG